MTTYHLLGRTGLRVSRLGLGAMTFGQDGWGADETTARELFAEYLASGGNFVDTANGYAQGRSEEIVGKLIAETGSRDRVVLSTKFTVPSEPGNPNALGNGRKNMLASLDASLRRLGTDYVDLYWMHLWDTVTPAEEVMSTFDALVRSGKVRAIGLSDVPAWYAAKAQVLARANGWEPVAALQLEYSLVQRGIELEHLPAAADLGLGLVTWSPLAYGFLSGKYNRADGVPAGSGRLDVPPFNGDSGFVAPYTDRQWDLLDELRAVAGELGRSPAQVAVNWVTGRPGVTSTLLGARNTAQLKDNLGALDFELPAGHAARLEAVCRPERYMPYTLFDQEFIDRLFTRDFEVRA